MKIFLPLALVSQIKLPLRRTLVRLDAARTANNTVNHPYPNPVLYKTAKSAKLSLRKRKACFVEINQ